MVGSLREASTSAVVAAAGKKWPCRSTRSAAGTAIARMAGEASIKARTTTMRRRMSEAAARIGDVVELINTLPGKPICWHERHDRGGAGREAGAALRWWFEVKALAEQTAKATGEIGQQAAAFRPQRRSR